jgi:hypothetical protein
MVSLYLHIEGLDAALVEVDQMPSPSDNAIICKNPRRRDGKDWPYLIPEVNIIIIPMNRIVFIEVMSQQEEEDVTTFIRE